MDPAAGIARVVERVPSLPYPYKDVLHPFGGPQAVAGKAEAGREDLLPMGAIEPLERGAGVGLGGRMDLARHGHIV